MNCLWIFIWEIYNLDPVDPIDLDPQFYFAILPKTKAVHPSLDFTFKWGVYLSWKNIELTIST